MDITDIRATDFQDEIIGPIIIEEDREQVTKRMKNDKCMDILSGYPSSIIQGFENYLRTEIDLVEDDIRIVLEENILSFNTYALQPGIYNFKDLSEARLKILQPDYEGYHNAIDIEFDDITLKTKLFVTFGYIVVKFDEKSYFNTILSFAPRWDYKNYIKYNRQKIVNLSSTNQIHLKCDFTEGSIVSGLRQPLFFSFVLDKPSGYKVFLMPKTIHYQKKDLF